MRGRHQCKAFSRVRAQKMPLIVVTNCWLFLEGQEGASESHGLYLETDTDYPDSDSSGRAVCMCVHVCVHLHVLLARRNVSKGS